MRRTITKKIVLSYLVIIIVALLFVAMLFSLSVRRFVEGQVRDNLQKDAELIVNALKKNDGATKKDDAMPKRDLLSDGDSNSKRIQQMIRESIKRGIGLQDSSHVVVTRDYEVLFSRSMEDAERFNEDLLPLIKERLSEPAAGSFKVQLDGKEYMLLFTPVPDDNRKWVISYTSVQGISELSRSLMEVFLLALALTLVIALAFGAFIARSVAKPIVMLSDRAVRLSKRDFDTKVEIKTGDELEELANTIDKMASELKEYDTAQMKFLQNASHELKTPLMSIQGYAEGIKDGVFDDNNKALDIIVEESTRLKKLVEEIIYLSKLETMEEFYKLNLESVNDVILKSVEKVNSLAVRNSINIEYSFSKDMLISLDRDKLTQALINILGNCLRYAASKINITTENKNRSFEIVISDDGDGFEQDELKHVFERFYKGKKGNTGLGLAITKVIIEKHKGMISVSNNPDGGAVFKIILGGNELNILQ